MTDSLIYKGWSFPASTARYLPSVPSTCPAIGKSTRMFPMIQMLTHHPAASLIAFLSLVVLTFVSNRLGLISWVARLGRHEEDRHEEKRDSEDTEEYWRIHR
jgi:hypothetical protein